VRARKAAGLAVLLLGSTALSYLAAEAAARVVSPFSETQPKLWLLSSPTFRLDSQGAVRYLKNQTIRTVMLDGDHFVYDVRFRTNDLGFIDHEDYLSPSERRADAPRYAFVGDSFTAGFHSGTPWVPALRDRAREANPSLEIYNLGVSGTGFEHFVRLLESVGTQVEFSEIVILAISDDFPRPFWRPLVKGDAIRFCRAESTPSDCVAAPPMARIFDAGLDQAEVLALAARLWEGQISGPRKLRHLAIEHSRLAGLLFEQYLRLKLQFSRGFRESLDRLGDLRDAFPTKRIRFVHLPTMEELSRLDYDVHPEDEIAKLGIEYFPALTACSWPEEMFLSDGHPNAGGYDAIARCVSTHLGLAH